jgi:hypothetical protein
MFTMLLLGLAAWIATSTIVEAEVFRDVREAIFKLYDRRPNWWTYKLKYFVKCHMCTGIWVSAVIALFVAPVASSGIVGWGLTALAIKGIAHLALVVQKLAEARTDWLNNDSILNAMGPAEELERIHDPKWDCLKG